MAKMQLKTMLAMLEENKGESYVNKMVGLLIIAILVGALVPTSMTAIKSANQTNWTTSEVSTYSIIGIMIIIAVVLMIVKIATGE
jgi:uncharacterized membrane protein YidH (DUF202 family)